MLNLDNANSIGASIGKCIRVKDSQIMHQRTYLRLQVEIDMADPLLSGFKWIDSRGQEKWASIRYKSLADVCY